MWALSCREYLNVRIRVSMLLTAYRILCCESPQMSTYAAMCMRKNIPMVDRFNVHRAPFMRSSSVPGSRALYKAGRQRRLTPSKLYEMGSIRYCRRSAPQLTLQRLSRRDWLDLQTSELIEQTIILGHALSHWKERQRKANGDTLCPLTGCKAPHRPLRDVVD